MSGGHAVCATCGFPLIGGRTGTDPRTGSGRRGYVCNTNGRKDRGTCVRPARVLAEPLEDHVRRLLLDYVLTEQVREEERMADEPWTPLAPGEDPYPLEPRDMDLSAIPAELREQMLPSVADARARLDAVEAQVAQVEALRGTLPEAALSAALEAVDRQVYTARQALELAEVGAQEDRSQPGPEDIAVAPTSVLGEYLEAYGLAVRVEPAFGDRRPGRVPERVTLVPRAT